MAKLTRIFNGREYTRVYGGKPRMGRGYDFKTKEEAKRAGSSFPQFSQRITPKKSGGKIRGFNLYIGSKKKR